VLHQIHDDVQKLNQGVEDHQAVQWESSTRAQGGKKHESQCQIARHEISGVDANRRGDRLVGREQHLLASTAPAIRSSEPTVTIALTHHGRGVAMPKAGEIVSSVFPMSPLCIGRIPDEVRE
jgi:hypothetical protein